MNPHSHEDWLDHVSGPRPDPESIRRLQSHGVLNPAEQRRLADELALNRLLDSHRPAPPVSSNFTALVIQQVEREGRSPRPSWDGGTLRRWLRPLATATALACLVAWVALVRRPPGPGPGEGALALDHAASLPGINPAVLADFDAVLRLGSSPRPDDEDLILALAQ